MSIAFRIGKRIRFEGTICPSVQGDTHLVMRDITIIHSDDARESMTSEGSRPLLEEKRTDIGNMHVFRRSRQWQHLRDNHRVQYTAQVRDWTITVAGLYVAVVYPNVITEVTMPKKKRCTNVLCRTLPMSHSRKRSKRR